MLAAKPVFLRRQFPITGPNYQTAFARRFDASKVFFCHKEAQKAQIDPADF